MERWTIFFRRLRSATAILAVVSTLLFSVYALLPIFGEPPRLEQEYKLSISGTLSSEQKRALYDLVVSDLPKREWANAAFISGAYYMGSDLDTLYFEDTYFDTGSGDLERLGISHRLRYRWNSEEDVFSHAEKGIVPQRVELQTKAYGTGAIADSDGYKKAMKNRYEIKKDFRLNPITQTILRRENGEAFVGLLQVPVFGSRFSPVRLVEDALAERGESRIRYADLRPAVEMVTTRTRFHINKKTPFGYGDNPDNAFLVSIDESRVYEMGTRNVVAEFSEIEIDFERNTFFKLFDSVYRAGNAEHAAILKSFEADQKALKDMIAEELSSLGFPPETGSVVSKYSKAFRAAEGEK